MLWYRQQFYKQISSNNSKMSNSETNNNVSHPSRWKVFFKGTHNENMIYCYNENRFCGILLAFTSNSCWQGVITPQHIWLEHSDWTFSYKNLIINLSVTYLSNCIKLIKSHKYSHVVAKYWCLWQFLNFLHNATTQMVKTKLLLDLVLTVAHYLYLKINY